MAITILKDLEKVSPAYNEIITVLSSTNSGEENFSFVSELFIDGVFRSKRNHPTNLNGYGVIDSHNILEDYVNFQDDFNFDSTLTFQRIPDLYKNYKIYYGEEFIYKFEYDLYNDNGGFSEFSSTTNVHYFSVNDLVIISGDTGIPNLNITQTVTTVIDDYSFVTDLAFEAGSTAGSPFINNDDFSNTQILSGASTSLNYIYNGASNYMDFINYDYTDYILSSATSQLLTKIPNNFKIKENDKSWLFAYNDAVASILNHINVKTYDEYGNALGKYRVLNPYTTDTDLNKFLYIGVGPKNLANTTSPITTISGTLPIIDSNVGSYEVYAYSTIDGQISKTYNFEIIDENCKYDKIRFMFLDSSGSMIGVTFDLSNENKLSIKRKEFNKNYGNVDDPTQGWTYSRNDRGSQIYNVDITETYSVNSDWITEDQNDIISNLIYSPVQYVEINDELFPIVITNSKLTKKRRVNEKLINWKIDFKFSFKNNVQNG